MEILALIQQFVEDLKHFFIHQIMRCFHSDFFINFLRVRVFLFDIKTNAANIAIFAGFFFDEIVKPAVNFSVRALRAEYKRSESTKTNDCANRSIQT